MTLWHIFHIGLHAHYNMNLKKHFVNTYLELRQVKSSTLSMLIEHKKPPTSDDMRKSDQMRLHIMQSASTHGDDKIQLMMPTAITFIKLKKCAILKSIRSHQVA